MSPSPPGDVIPSVDCCTELRQCRLSVAPFKNSAAETNDMKNRGRSIHQRDVSSPDVRHPSGAEGAQPAALEGRADSTDGAWESTWSTAVTRCCEGQGCFYRNKVYSFLIELDKSGMLIMCLHTYLKA